MSSDERLMYNLHRCVQPKLSSVHGNYLGQCTAQLDACSHKYDADIVCGAHRKEEDGGGGAPPTPPSFFQVR